MYGSPIKDSGWIRSNHRVAIEARSGDEFYASLICPPCCPTVANAHLHYVPNDDEHAFLQWGAPPLETVEGCVRQCMAAYEQEAVGLLNDFTDTLDEHSWPIVKALPDGLHDFEIEFGAEYGWSQAGPWGEAEYEWIFYWRLLGEERL